MPADNLPVLVAEHERQEQSLATSELLGLREEGEGAEADLHKPALQLEGLAAPLEGLQSNPQDPGPALGGQEDPTDHVPQQVHEKQQTLTPEVYPREIRQQRAEFQNPVEVLRKTLQNHFRLVHRLLLEVEEHAREEGYGGAKEGQPIRKEHVNFVI